MSLRSQPIGAVPEETRRVARAAFPRGHLWLVLRDELGSIFTDESFASLFPQRGQPAIPPWRLAVVTLLQYAEGLSDRQAADAVRGRIDWKYLLGLELADPGFDYSVLCEFRARLLAGGAEAQLLDLLLEQCKMRGLLRERGRQRTDSTHVLACVRAMNRLECAAEALRHALNALAVVAPEWLRFHCPPRVGRAICASARQPSSAEVGGQAPCACGADRYRWRPAPASPREGRHARMAAADSGRGHAAARLDSAVLDLRLGRVLANRARGDSPFVALHQFAP